MLLRRITQHVKDQNWLAVGIDFAIVVFGVFIGLQVANWNEARVERTIEKDTLIRLYADIQESIDGQMRDLNFLQQQLDDQRVVLAALDACAVTPDQENIMQRGITTLGWINPPRLYRRTIDEVTSSGRTDIFTNSDLAEELARIVALVEWRASWFDHTMRGVNDYRQDVEPFIRYRLDRMIENPFVPNHRGGVDYDIEELCVNRRLTNAISATSNATSERLEAYRPILEAYEGFAPRIAAELESRWNVRITASDLP